MKKIFLIFLISSLNLLSDKWWNENWKYRKKFEFDIKEGSSVNCGVVEFNGFCKEGGEDIMVIDENGNEVEYYLVRNEKPLYQIIFPIKTRFYYIYYGNEKPEKRNYNFSPKCGLILEIYERKGNKVGTVEECKEIIEKSIMEGKLIGKRVWKRIWDGTNPFGPQKDIVKIYTGYFYIQKEGNYEFATSSAGPSFISIDDKIIAKWTGWHGARPFVAHEQTGSIFLEKGVHKFIYYHIGATGYEISVAAVKFPGKDKFDVIPEDFWIPLIEGKVVNCERKDGKINIDFEWENTNFLRRQNWNLITYKFNERIYGGNEVIFREWDFGDGQKKNEKEPIHTYIGDGIYNVSLTVKDKNGNKETIIYPVKVEADYSKIYLYPRKYEEYIEEFEKFNLKTLPTEKLQSLAEIFLSYNRFEDTFKSYNELRNRNLEEREKIRVSILSAEIARKIGKLEQAEKICKEILSFKFVEDIYLKLGNLYIEMGKTDEAMEIFRKIIEKKEINEDIKRKAEIGIADIYRLKGEKTNAEEVYREFTDENQYKFKNYGYAHQVLYYLKNKDFSTSFEILEKWADIFPLCKIDGIWSVLKVRTHILAGENEKALKEIEIFTKIAEPDNIYIPVINSLKSSILNKIGGMK